MTIIIDSSVYISHFGISDQYSSESKQFFDSIQNDLTILMPTLVLLETMTILMKQHSSDIQKILHYLSKFPPVEINAAFVQEYTKMLTATPTTMKTSDTIIAVTAAINKATLITWDRRLLSKDQPYCRAMTPSQFLSE